MNEWHGPGLDSVNNPKLLHYFLCNGQTHRLNDLLSLRIFVFFFCAADLVNPVNEDRIRNKPMSPSYITLAPFSRTSTAQHILQMNSLEGLAATAVACQQVRVY